VINMEANPSSAVLVKEPSGSHDGLDFSHHLKIIEEQDRDFQEWQKDPWKSSGLRDYYEETENGRYPGARRFLYYIRVSFRGFAMQHLEAYPERPVPPYKTQYNFVAKKGPVNGGFWGTWSFDSFGQNRLITLVIRLDPGARGELLQQPVLQWARPSDPARRKALASKSAVPTVADFGEGDVRGAAPLFVHEDFLKPMDCDALKAKSEQKQYKSLSLPKVRGCGSSPKAFASGSSRCLCVFLGQDKEAFKAASVLRLFFYDEATATKFIEVIEGVTDMWGFAKQDPTSLGSWVRRRPNAPIS
jgi:hypothetical protein